MDDGVDPSILASLPPSMQLDLLVQVSVYVSGYVCLDASAFRFSKSYLVMSVVQVSVYIFTEIGSWFSYV